MRVIEIGVQKFGEKLGVSFPKETNWQRILNDINKPIRDLPEKTEAEKNLKIQYAGIAAHLYHIKLAWRNPTMHPRNTYTVEQAKEVYDHSRSFMNTFSRIL